MMREHGITADHLARGAVVYVRQSSPEQVRDNMESTRIQLALREKAIALGWPDPVVIDNDLGISASGFADRPGFNSLLAMVTTKAVGIIICIDASRLSRNSKDWAQLLELCGFFGTLIADADQVYDMTHPNDRMLMGVKGSISEMELGLIRQRLQSGKESKASRGELRVPLPIGYVYDVDEKIVFDPDQQVRVALEAMFDRFDRCTSVRQLAFWYRDTDTAFPSRHGGVLGWGTPSSNRLRQLLTHPCYGGAYTYGRRETLIEYQDGRLVKRATGPRPAEQAKVCINDHHRGYITWDRFLANRVKISENRPRWTMRENQGAIREGLALLVGLLRCGTCGRRVRVRYKKSSALYHCDGGDEKGSQQCIAFGSSLIDARISEEICRAVQPQAIQASILAAEMDAAEHAQNLESARLQVDALQYGANRAFEQFDRCDPKNRLVVDTLEDRLNERLEKLSLAKERHNEIANAELVVSESKRAQLETLSRDFSKVWGHQEADPKLKKQLLRASIREILVAPQGEDQLEATIHWRGGVHSRVSVMRPVRKTGRTHESIEKLIGELAEELRDEEIARILNMKKLETAGGLRWTRIRVQIFRQKHKIKAAPRTKPQDTMTMKAVQEYFGISSSGVEGLARLGAITPNQITEFAPWRIPRAEVESEHVNELVRVLKQTGRLPKGGSAQSQPGLFDTNKAVTSKPKEGAL
jgi:DNA invertase Pin-like site-specific DNA recombinase